PVSRARAHTSADAGRLERTTMDIAVWIVSGVLAAMYLFAGITKATTPRDALLPKMPWVEDFSARTVRVIGVAELLGAVALVLPWLLDVAPVLTPVAATGLVVVQVLAIR